MHDVLVKKALKFILIITFVFVAKFMIVENIKSKDLAPLGLSQQHTSDNANKKNEFLLLHKTLDELSETWPEDKIQLYQKAVEKFPNVDACLVIPKDVNTINWPLIKTTTELEVCLSRLHSFIGDVHESEKWFKRQGFSVNVQSYSRGTPPRTYYSVSARWIIPSSGSLKGRKSPMSGINIYFEEFFAIAGVGVAVEINPENIVTNVTAGYSRK